MTIVRSIHRTAVSLVSTFMVFLTLAAALPTPLLVGVTFAVALPEASIALLGVAEKLPTLALKAMFNPCKMPGCPGAEPALELVLTAATSCRLLPTGTGFGLTAKVSTTWGLVLIEPVPAS